MVRNNEREIALPYLETALKLSHRLTERDRLLIDAWHAIARFDNEGAIEAFQIVIERYPGEIEAYHRLAYMLNGQGEIERAVEVLQRALLIDPEARDIYNALGFMLPGLESVAAHKRYVKLAPNEPNAYDSLGLSYIESGLYQEAAEAFGKALDLDPGFHFAHLHQADIDFAVGRLKSAERRYLRHLEVAPSDWDEAFGWNRLVLLYLRKGQLEAAEHAALQERSLANDFGGLFRVRLAQGKLSEAQELMSQLRRDSTFTEDDNNSLEYQLLHLEALLSRAKGEMAGAESQMRAAFSQGKHTFNIGGFSADLADLLQSLEKHQDAQEEYERILALNPNYPPALYGLALLFESTNRPQEAKRYFQHFLEIWRDADPDLPVLQKARMGSQRSSASNRRGSLVGSTKLEILSTRETSSTTGKDQKPHSARQERLSGDHTATRT